MSAPSSEAPTEPAISVRGLRVRRGEKEVLHGLEFAVPHGAISGLLGPSGCGKTTLMRAIVGVQIIESGDVEVLGEEAGSPALRGQVGHRLSGPSETAPRRQVGYVTQAPSVYGDLSVVENLDYFARILDAPAERVDRVIETVGLSAQTGQVVSSLSGGQRSRVSLATALLGEPQLLVLDEPTVGLDPVLREDLWRTFRTLAEGGSTLLVSSHVLDEADHCHELLLMREGRLLGIETPAGLRARTGEEKLEDAFLALIRSVGEA
jgi:ABC-2 type transport system ATP-binding protein